MHAKTLEVTQPKKSAEHCADDTPVGFLVTRVAGTIMKFCPVFFPHQDDASFFAENNTEIWLIG